MNPYLHTGRFFLCCCIVTALACTMAGTPDERKQSYSFRGKSIIVAVRQLSQGFQQRICVEEVGVYAGISRRDTAAKERIRSTRQKGVPVVVTNVTLVTMLNARCDFDNTYQWTRDDETGVFNIYPEKTAPLSWSIPMVAFKDVSVMDVFLQKDLLGLKKHRVAFDLGSGNLSWSNAKVSLQGTNITARMAMNNICAQLKPPMRWELMSTPRMGGILDRVLMIRPVGLPAELSLQNKP